MSDNGLILEYSIEVDVSVAFAWRFRTDVANWNDPSATFQLDGPFAQGTRGTTQMPGQDPVLWFIKHVVPGSSFIVEMPLDGATLQFEWHFAAISGQRTRLTQCALLTGHRREAYAHSIETSFGSTLAEGMKRIAADMMAAERLERS
jgi:hypothetical protein